MADLDEDLKLSVPDILGFACVGRGLWRQQVAVDVCNARCESGPRQTRNEGGVGQRPLRDPT
jgi:hypothetical protein